MHDDRESVWERRLELRAVDGYPLRGTLFEPRGAAGARKNLILHPATATPARFYTRFARRMAASGLRVLSYDYRGIGGSRPAGGLVEFRRGMIDWIELDAQAAQDFVFDHHGDVPTAALGHSFGGQHAALLRGAERLNCLVHVAAQSGWYRHWSGGMRRRRWLEWQVMPALAHLLGEVPGWAGLGHPLPGPVALEWARWCKHPEYLRGYYPALARGWGAFRAPLLAFSFADDALAPLPAVRWLLEQHGSEQLEHVHVAAGDRALPLGHFGFFRPPNAALWDRVARFLEQPVTTPKGARTWHSSAVSSEYS